MNTNNNAANRINKDCWSNILSFLPTMPSKVWTFQPPSDRFLIAVTSKEIYESLQGSFTGQTVDLTRSSRILNSKLKILASAKAIYLNGCDWLTDENLSYLKNVKTIFLYSTNITDAGLAHLKKVKLIDLGSCKYITEAGKQSLIKRGVKGRFYQNNSQL